MQLNIEQTDIYPAGKFHDFCTLAQKEFASSKASDNTTLFLLKSDDTTLLIGEVYKKAWDSEHFGCRIGELLFYENLSYTVEEKDLQEFFNYIMSSLKKAYDMIFSRISTDRKIFARCAENNNFRIMDTQIEYEFLYDRQKISDIEGTCLIRQAKPEDLEQLKRIARESFSKTRFHADPRLGKEASDNLYQIWLEKSINDNFADLVLVAEAANEPIGFATWNLVGEGPSAMGRLELTAVDARMRNRGIYAAIVNEGIKYFQNKGCGVYTSTQINNIAGQRVWIKLGFTLKNNWYVFHCWL